MNLWKTSLATLLVAALALSAKAAELKVVTTFLPVYCWSASVASGAAQVENLMEGTVGPHEFQLTPSHLRKLNAADLVIYIGLELEPWLETMIENGSLKKRVRTLSLGERLDQKRLIPYGQGGEHPDSEAEHDGHDHDADHDDHNDHKHGQYDPHIWLDPVLAKECVAMIAEQLGQMDSENAALFQKNAEAYSGKLDQLDKELKEGLKGVQDKPFYTQHDAFSYFNRRYGLKCAGVLQQVPDSDVSPRHLAALLKKIRDEGVVAILLPSKSPDRLAERLARDGNIRLGKLETLETLDEQPLGRDTYERMMKENLSSLLESLK
jgi:ABC-type Zn uptake system ZnuABC Zn-binding protein ZnuA